MSGLLGARLALGLPDDALSAWRQEGATFRVGTILLVLGLVALLDGLVVTRRRALVTPLALVGIAVAVPATSVFGLAAALPLMAFALLPTRPCVEGHLAGVVTDSPTSRTSSASREV